MSTPVALAWLGVALAWVYLAGLLLAGVPHRSGWYLVAPAVGIPCIVVALVDTMRQIIKSEWKGGH